MNNMANWRNKVDMSIKDHLEEQIAESSKHKDAYMQAKDPAEAQLWCAIANLSKQIFELSLRVKYLENSLKQNSEGSEDEGSKEFVRYQRKKETKKLKKTLQNY